MFKKIVFAFGVCLLTSQVTAQTEEIASILQEVERNNKELQAFSSLMESRQLALKSGNNLPDPQFGAYYLPFGNHSTGDYSEFQITQSFEFPSVYSARKNMIGKQKAQMDLEFDSKRHEVLLTAKKYCLELVYLNKRIETEQERIEQAKKVYDQVEALLQNEQVGILEVNKAKVAWIQEEFKIEKIRNEANNLLLLLQNLNGGIEVKFNSADYVNSLSIDPLETIWESKQAQDPMIRMLNQKEEIALQEVKLSKSKGLPNLTAGFNYQGVSNANYSGLFGGVSIPLWSNKHKVASAEASYSYLTSSKQIQSDLHYTKLQEQYNNYHSLLTQFRSYERTLSSLNSAELLLKAYELSEISFTEYYMELLFYRQAHDAMLDMENQLHQLKSELLKHQL